MTDTAAPTLSSRILGFVVDLLIVAGGNILLMGVPVLSGLLGGVYLAARDGVEVGPLRFRSVGKYVMGLDLVRVDGRPITLETSLRRNWMLAVGSLSVLFSGAPFLALMVSLAGTGLLLYETYNVVTDGQGRRWGDRLAHTQVVQAGSGLL